MDPGKVIGNGNGLDPCNSNCGIMTVWTLQMVRLGWKRKNKADRSDQGVYADHADHVGGNGITCTRGQDGSCM